MDASLSAVLLHQMSKTEAVTVSVYAFTYLDVALMQAENLFVAHGEISFGPGSRSRNHPSKVTEGDK